MSNPFDSQESNQLTSILNLVDQEPRIIQLTQVHNGEKLIKPCLLQAYNEVDQIICIEGAVRNRPNSTEDGHSTDKTLEMIDDVIANHDPDNKIIKVQIGRHWENLEEMKNAFFQYLRPNDFALILDVDEFILPGTVDKLRQAISLEPTLNEIVPTFFHFWKDRRFVRNPNKLGFGHQHQRFIRFQNGMHYRHHPVATTREGHCTYFSQHLFPFRFTLDDFKIFHYSYMNFNSEDIHAKKEFYDKELKGNDAGAWERHAIHDQFVNYTENKDDLLVCDLEHPEIVKSEGWFNELDTKLGVDDYPSYNTVTPYSYKPEEHPLIYAWMVKDKRVPLFINNISLVDNTVEV